MEDINTFITAVIRTLETVQVQGRDNMNKILSCIAVLEKILNNDTDDIIISGDAKSDA